MSGSFSRWAGRARTAWVFFGACLLALVCAELAAKAGFFVLDHLTLALQHRRIAAKTPCEQVMEQLRLRWQPYTYWRGTPTTNSLVTVEPDGRRRTWHPTRVEATAPLVSVSGGSAVWGMCVNDDATIPSALARDLDQSGIAARVENHAQIGWVTTQSLLDLLLDLRAGHVPQVAVFYEGWNDIVAGFAERQPGIPLNEANREKEFDLLKRPGTLRLYALGNPMNSSMGRIATALRRKLHLETPGAQARAVSDATVDSLAREVVRIYTWNVAAVERLGREYHFQPLFYWQPDVVGKTTLTDLERRTLAEDPAMVRFTRAVRREIALSDSLRARADFRDLEPYFDDDQQEIFYDWCHVTAGANARIADVIAADVRRTLGGDRPHPR